MTNNLQDISVAYESGWNRLTEKFYAKAEWPEAEVIAPLVGEGLSSQSCQRLLLHLHLFRSHLPSPLQGAILPTCLLAAFAQRGRSLSFI